MNEPKNHELLHPVYPPYIDLRYPDDEINLVDLWIELKRFKKTFFVTFSALLVLGLIFIFFVFQEKYSLTSAIEIGTISKQGGFELIESPDSLKSKLQDAIVPKVTANWVDDHPQLKPFDTEVSYAKNSNLILIKNKATKPDSEMFIQFQDRLVSVVISDHQAKFDKLQADLFAQLESEKYNLAQLEKPETLKQLIDRQKIEIKQYQEKLADLKDNFKLVKQAGPRALLASMPPDEQAKFISNGGNLIDDLLKVQLDQFLLDNQSRQTEIRSKLEQSQLKIEEIEKDHQFKIGKQQLLVAKIQSQLDSADLTNVVGGPVMSLQPASLNRKLLIMLDILLSLMAGFIFVLLHLFHSKVRQREREIE